MRCHLTFENKEITLLGTAHVSKESTELVNQVILDEKPDTVCVELCPSRLQSISKKDHWQEMDIVKVIREKKAFLLLANLLLASFQKRIAAKLDVQPGGEMLKAIETADAVGAAVQPVDRDIRVTLSRAWRVMGWWDKLKILFQLILSLGDVDGIREEDIERMKQEDILQTILAEVGSALPGLRAILIDERDQYLAYKIKTAPGNRIVAVVGAGHVPGIKANWNSPADIDALEKVPSGKGVGGVFRWLLPMGILALLIAGFFYGGADKGTDMLRWWILVNGVLAGLGAVIALAHPLTVVSSVVAAPLTSLNPMIAAGWVSGLVEAFSRKPKVRDFERLPEDIVSLRGFWRNKVTRILMVVVLTNLGSAVGTFVAIPLMAKLL